MAKKKKEEIVLNKTELVPTTIGVLDKRENGPIVAIVLIILFVVCIFLLPYFNEWLNGVDTVVETPTDTPSPSIDDEPNEDPAPETQYYPISSDLSIDIDGYSFSSFVIQNNNQTLSYTITNTVVRQIILKPIIILWNFILGRMNCCNALNYPGMILLVLLRLL